MKALQIISLFLLIGISFSCDKETTQAQDAKALEKIFAEIETMAKSKACNDSSQWMYTNYGAKACGGPVGYIAFPTNIDLAKFYKKVEKHRSAQKSYNAKWGIMSDCSIPQEPNGVACEDGKPVLIYE